VCVGVPHVTLGRHSIAIGQRVVAWRGGRVCLKCHAEP
jgi:hypothetical protein